MTDTFHTNSLFEKEGERIFVPAFNKFLQSHNQYMKAHNTREQQKEGDYSIFRDSQVLYKIDRKHERVTSPNLFFETYSIYYL